LIKYSLNPLSFSITATFNTTKLSVEDIVEKLKQGGYPVSGEPQILE
jgi:hypothetical protein